MSVSTRVLTLLAAYLLASACQAPATARAPEDSPAAAPAAAKAEAEPKKRRSSCAFRRTIRGYSVIDRDHFVLESGSNEFLVTLSGGCLDLDRGIAIAIKSTPGASICVERGDRVILDRFDTCIIREIEPVENMEEARKLVAERTGKNQDENEE